LQRVLAATGTGPGTGDQRVDVRFGAIADVVDERDLGTQIVLVAGLTVEEQRERAGRHATRGLSRGRLPSPRIDILGERQDREDRGQNGGGGGVERARHEGIYDRAAPDVSLPSACLAVARSAKADEGGACRAVAPSAEADEAGGAGAGL